MTVRISDEFLKKIPLFQGLTLEELNKIKSLLHTKTYSGDSNIIIAQQPGETVFFVVEGAVKIQSEQADGTFVILSIMGPGEMVGEMSLLDNECRSATVITLEPTTICWLSRANFWQCLQSMPAMNTNLIQIITRRLRQANERAHLLATQDVYGRVAQQLLVFARDYGALNKSGATSIPFRITQTDLAGMIGATRVRVNQVLSTYRQLEFVTVDPNFRITIKDPEALSKRCGLSV
ncbi:MAG TPA: Crp/Fnr family transcriptional regulator [Chloroflexia bacterium]|nr:Crp/Fnr family transcriptional regulator [Chloroflexia bacterium]